jgi:hypothetical protein
VHDKGIQADDDEPEREVRCDHATDRQRAQLTRAAVSNTLDRA